MWLKAVEPQAPLTLGSFFIQQIREYLEVGTSGVCAANMRHSALACPATDRLPARKI
jgi:hypothetical protein